MPSKALLVVAIGCSTATDAMVLPGGQGFSLFYERLLREHEGTRAPEENLTAASSFLEAKEDYKDRTQTFDNVQCRCAPVRCNCTKGCTCYMKPDGQREEPTFVNKYQGVDNPELGNYEGPIGTKAQTGAASARSSATLLSAVHSPAWHQFFQQQSPPSFLETVQRAPWWRESARRRRRGGDTCAEKFAPGRSRLRGLEEAWCVSSPPDERGREAQIAAAADERRGFSLLEVTHSARQDGLGIADFLTRPQLLHYGADPDFRPTHRGTYHCDVESCSKMACKCSKYCRCRGVAVPLFAGEDSLNSKGGWVPNLERVYYYNTDPPRSG